MGSLRPPPPVRLSPGLRLLEVGDQLTGARGAVAVYRARRNHINRRIPTWSVDKNNTNNSNSNSNNHNSNDINICICIYTVIYVYIYRVYGLEYVVV